LPLAKEMEDVSGYNQLEENLDLSSVIQLTKENITSEDSFVILAEAVEEIGFISATIEESPPVFSRGDRLKINEIYVTPEYRRQGVASKLISKIRRLTEYKDVETIELNVNIRNESAQELYQNLGFKTEKKRMIKWID